MNYISTRGQSPRDAALGFEDVLLAGLASDGGLYVPQSWPQLTPARIASFATADYTEVARHVLSAFVGDDIEPTRLGEMIDQAYTAFGVEEIAPLRPLEDGHYLLELFHGPTLAFKDIAMQLLARLMDDALMRRGRRVTIIGATSGDTGGAAIEAFRDCKSVDIFILFPDGRVSDVQRRQMTTASGTNVHALAVDGTFDDCQVLVKGMFNDAAFRAETGLAGVNSINWARVMAQTVYYFTTAAKLGAPRQPVSFCVPTGNFGDIFAGYVAAQMGLPVAQLVIATNVNDSLVRTLATGTYEIGAVMATQSPSMDIQLSSNFERLLFELTGRDATRLCAYMEALKEGGRFTLSDKELRLLRSVFAAERIDEGETIAVMRDVYERLGFQIDPHSAVGVGAARQCVLDDVPMVTLATAHPAKFPDAAQAAYNASPDMPLRLQAVMELPERITKVADDIKAVQHIIRKAHRHG